MKKMICILLCASMLALASCGLMTCKEPGCNSTRYKDGYCEVHYALNIGAGILGNLFG